MSGRAFVIDLGGVRDGDDAGRGIDGEAAAGRVAGQAVGHGRAVDVGGGGGDTDGRTVGCAFGDGVGRRIAVRRCRGRHIGDGNGESLRTRQRAVAGLRGHRIGMAGGALVVYLGRVGDGDDAGRRVYRKAAAGSVAGQTVGHGRAVDVGRGRGDAHGETIGRTFGDRIGRRIAVNRRRWRDVGHRNREGLRTRQRAVAGLRGDGIGVAGRGLVIDLGGIGDGDDTGRGIDGEAAAGGIADQAVGHGRAVDVGGRGGDADGRAVGRTFDHGVGRGIAVDRRRRCDVGHGDGEGLRRGLQAVIGLHGDSVTVAGARTLVVDLAAVGDGDHAGRGIDREAAAGGVAGQRIGGHRSVRIERQRRDADGGPVGRTFRHAVGGGVGVDRCRQRHVVYIDGEGLRTRQRAVAGLRGYGVGMAGRALEVDLGGIGDRDDAGHRIDLEAAAGRVGGQAVGHGRTVDVRRCGGDADLRIGGRAFRDSVGRGIAVDGRRWRDVGYGDGEVLRAGYISVARIHGDRVGVTRCGLEIDLAGIGDRHHAGCRIDLEAAAGGIGAERVDDGQTRGADRVRGDADQRIDGRAFSDAVGCAVRIRSLRWRRIQKRKGNDDTRRTAAWRRRRGRKAGKARECGCH